MKTEQTLQQALEHHRAGRLEEAVELYQSLLEAEPDHAEVNHNMGVLAVQVGQPAGGLPYFEAALDADPQHAKYWLSYIDALFQAGHQYEAQDVLALARQQGLKGDEVEALAVRMVSETKHDQVTMQGASATEHPKLTTESQLMSQEKNRTKSHKGRGKTAASGSRTPDRKAVEALLTAFQKGRIEEAAVLAKAMTREYPRYDFGWKALGAVFQQTGQVVEALVPMQKSIDLSPGDVEAHYNLGVVLQKLGRLEEAETSYRQAIDLDPAYADAYSNLGAILHGLGRLNEAETSIGRALQIKPRSASGHGNLGVILQHLGRMEEAEASFRRALQIFPDQAETHNNLGNTLKELGRPEEAEISYRSAIRISPDFADAYNNLGIILQEMKRFSDAEASYRKALVINPGFAAAYNNLGHTLNDTGRLSEAEAVLRLALQISPDYAEAHCNLGATLMARDDLEAAEACYRSALHSNPVLAKAHSNLGVTLQNMDRLDDAVACFEKALELAPEHVETHINLGNALKQLGRANEAEARYRRAIQISPNFAEAHYNLGISLNEREMHVEAHACYLSALAIKPDYVEVFNALGTCLMAMGHREEAEAIYRKALDIRPNFVDAHCNLGAALVGLGRWAEAEASYRRAILADPNCSVAHNCLGSIHMIQLQPEDAEASYRLAIAANPNFSEAHCNLSATLNFLGRLDESMASSRLALEIDPECAGAHGNLGSALIKIWQFDDAVASYRRALAIKPDFAEIYSNLIFALSHDESIDPPTLFAEHCRFGEQFETQLREGWPQFCNSRDPERRLQVGFVSADLRTHAVAYFIEPILAHLAGFSRLSLHAFYNHAVVDGVTERLKRHLQHWHPIFGLSDDAVAQKIEEENIDILIDLSGHTAGNRLLTFARKPAPIQASWIGYPGTTGLQAMDYYLADRSSFPSDRFCGQFTEALVGLPAGAAFLPYETAPQVNGLPALSYGNFTFGSFNNPDKITRSVIALWSQLLRALPKSRMLLAGMPTEGIESKLIEWFAQEGIGSNRLSFYLRSNMDFYLSLHHQVDICLDTFPYNGGTTTLHALWMGVPTLTLAGDTPAWRTGAAIFGQVGLDAFVAHDTDDFVKKGLSWASNLAGLHEIRKASRGRLAKAPICQPELIAASLDQAFRIMWQRWCEGLPAESFEVDGRVTAAPKPKAEND